jgi:hypothetical protein
MTRHMSQMMGLVGIAGLIAGLTGCLIGKSKTSGIIVQQPQSQIVKEGEKVSFSVVVSGLKNVSYQWQFNRSNLVRAMEATYTFHRPVGFENVGEYRVLVRGENGITLSGPAYLSVYAAAQVGNVSSGTLATPIGQFGNQTYSCGQATFKKGYTPMNASGQPMFFYGPNAFPQSGLFKNPGGCTDLTIDTFSADNGTADTGIRIQNNWIPLRDACCNDDATGGTYPKQSQCQLSLTNNPGRVANKNTYRLSILYKVPPGAPASGKVTFNWKYQ